MLLLGFDIGGTKCAVVTANWDGEHIELLKKEKCPTDLTVPPEEMLERLMKMADGILDGKPYHALVRTDDSIIVVDKEIVQSEHIIRIILKLRHIDNLVSINPPNVDIAILIDNDETLLATAIPNESHSGI